MTLKKLMKHYDQFNRARTRALDTLWGLQNLISEADATTELREIRKLLNEADTRLDKLLDPKIGCLYRYERLE